MPPPRAPRTREPTPGHRAAPTRGIGRGALTRAGHPMSMPVNAAGDGWRTEMSSQLGGALSKRHVGGPDPGGGVRRRRLLSAAAAIALAAGLAPVASNAAHGAATPLVAPAINPVVASSTQFDITGFLQSATLDSAADPHSGGTLTLNGHTVVVPKETIVILPASALTWQELFTHAPAPYGPTQTGMALGDSPKPLTTYEVHVVGNRVINGSGDRYIAGMVDISEQDLNNGAGYVNYLDYSTGEMEVGGTPGVAGTGTRVRIDDVRTLWTCDVAGRPLPGRPGQPDDPRRDRLPDVHPAHRADDDERRRRVPADQPARLHRDRHLGHHPPAGAACGGRGIHDVPDGRAVRRRRQHVRPRNVRRPAQAGAVRDR